MLNRTLKTVGTWSLRAAFVVWLLNVEDPVRLAAAVLVLTAQIPLQRQVLARAFPAR